MSGPFNSETPPPPTEDEMDNVQAQISCDDFFASSVPPSSPPGASSASSTARSSPPLRSPSHHSDHVRPTPPQSPEKKRARFRWRKNAVYDSDDGVESSPQIKPPQTDSLAASSDHDGCVSDAASSSSRSSSPSPPSWKNPPILHSIRLTTGSQRRPEASIPSPRDSSTGEVSTKKGIHRYFTKATPAQIEEQDARIAQQSQEDFEKQQEFNTLWKEMCKKEKRAKNQLRQARFRTRRKLAEIASGIRSPGGRRIKADRSVNDVQAFFSCSTS